ncbi:MAG: tRNA dihydrouridine(20/20a) synthase DusA [Betaproteobacteria bacterium]|nr:tRNA dihydrouridine(20/20a) synthase DusA [Betaproteobacteria bacterium]
MMDWTDRHCRAFHREISSEAFLYTEMVTTGALIHGDVERHLGFDSIEHPVALQLGGSEPADLAASARLGQRYGYSEVNLNCGCPSERVQRGAFGACLMETPEQVADCVRAMRDAVSIPVTVKHRIGLGRHEGYDFVRDFVGTVASAGCGLFIVHARNAWLDGLSPKENREVPPLRYEIVHRLKADFPDLTIILNGGLTTHEGASAAAQGLDGVMLGREAYHNPWVLAEVDSRWFGLAELPDLPRSRRAVAEAMAVYAEGFPELPARVILRHLLGLYHGQPRARLWRQRLSGAAAAAVGAAPTLLRSTLDLVDPV